MAEEFHSHLENVGLRTAILGQFNQMLSQSEYDMEQLIESVESLERGQERQRELGLSFERDLYNTSRMMRWEAEWFVQHVCERLREADAQILWGPVLRKIENHDLCIATTNYDRAVETACDFNSVQFDDGFDDFSEMEVASWKGVENGQNGRLKLLKVHGSTDWYLGEDSSIYKLRHPMPLYGNLALSFIDNASSQLPKMRSAMILPSREKRVTQPPYPDLTTDLRNTAREVEVAIFVGTSLRDPDLRDICKQCASTGPTFLVTINSPSNGPNIPNLMTIRETASRFLTSTLPRFLRWGDVEYLNKCVNETSTTVGTQSILASLVTALGPGGGVEEVCRAIDKLVSCHVMLDVSDIRRLLAPDRDESIRKYALALIPHSVDCEEAMTIAQEMAELDKEGAFAEEFQMMKTMMADSAADAV